MKDQSVLAVAFHIDPLLTAGELGTLVERTLTPEEGSELLWCVDPTARVVFTLAKGGFTETFIFDRSGRIAYQGRFPNDYQVLRQQIDELL